ETACCGSGPFRGIFSCGGKRGIPDYELCDNATEFLFFDSIHPNELASSQFAKMFWKGYPPVTGPYNLKALFDGCLSSQQAALFVFGDSLFDPGNNHHINTTADFQANFWPYGQSYFSPPTGRFSDGRLIPDFIGRAGALINSHAGFVVDLQTQLRYFGNLVNHYRQNLGDTKSRQLPSDAVYLFGYGGNDYQIPYYPYTQEQYVDIMIGNMTNVIKEIYEKGGRKFEVVTAPLIGCWLGMRVRQPGNTCNTENNELTRLYNQALAKRLEHLEKQLEGFMYAKFDLSTAISNRMKNPSKYGFRKAREHVAVVVLLEGFIVVEGRGE
nr:lipase, GDSL [Tanacetum cinerariifolium]